MTKQLSTEEIEKLFAFVESKNVPWKDVQFEIVDHLASEIEEKMTENTEMSFNRALDEVYGKFPITGFVHMVSEQEKAMKKHWMKRSLFLFFEYFKLPKLIITASLMLIMFQLVMYSNVIGWWASYLFTVLVVLSGHFIRRKRGDFEPDNPLKRLLFAKIMYGVSGVIELQLLIYPFLSSINSNDTTALSPLTLYLSIIYFGFSIMWTYAQVYSIPDMIKEEYKSKYSHLNVKLA